MTSDAEDWATFAHLAQGLGRFAAGWIDHGWLFPSQPPTEFQSLDAHHEIMVCPSWIPGQRRRYSQAAYMPERNMPKRNNAVGCDYLGHRLQYSQAA